MEQPVYSTLNPSKIDVLFFPGYMCEQMFVKTVTYDVYSQSKLVYLIFSIFIKETKTKKKGFDQVSLALGFL